MYLKIERSPFSSYIREKKSNAFALPVYFHIQHNCTGAMNKFDICSLFRRQTLGHWLKINLCTQFFFADL